MKSFFTALALYPWLALSQTITLPQPQQVLSQVKQFLGLTDAQVSAILQSNSEFNRTSFQQQRQIQNAQLQIAIETAKDSLDPMALGTLYAGIESACRELRDTATNLQKKNISILTDAQRTKLNLLTDAIKLAPVISEAQFANLLESTSSTPVPFSTFATGVFSGTLPVGVTGAPSEIFTGVARFPSSPGCSVAGNIILPRPLLP